MQPTHPHPHPHHTHTHTRARTHTHTHTHTHTKGNFMVRNVVSETSFTAHAITVSASFFFKHSSLKTHSCDFVTRFLSKLFIIDHQGEWLGKISHPCKACVHGVKNKGFEKKMLALWGTFNTEPFNRGCSYEKNFEVSIESCSVGFSAASWKNIGVRAMSNAWAREKRWTG